MAVTPLESGIYASLFAEAAVAACFTDAAEIQAMLDVESALARAQAALGLIPDAAAERITACARAERIEVAALRTGAERAGYPVIALVGELRRVVGEEAGAFVHWGATTQDIMDTGRVLQMRFATERLAAQLDEVMDALAALADRHRGTVMAGRTHGQQAVPTTFGLKAAGWLMPLNRDRDRLRELRPRLLTVQFGGAGGTLAALGDRGLAVMEALAEELGLAPSILPWHAQRDAFAELAGWLSLVTGSLAKMAQDVILLAQTELGEVYESADEGRGGSSTMPQKRNPIASEMIVAAARMNASLLPAMHHALVHEHERATHGWQLEWLSLPQMAVIASGTLAHASSLARNLVVDEGRMRENLGRFGGLILAEAVSFALVDAVGREAAHHLAAEASHMAAREERDLIDVVREMAGESVPEGAIDWESLADPANYLGEAERMIDRALAKAKGA